jgi:hypothetical protein
LLYAADTLEKMAGQCKIKTAVREDILSICRERKLLRVETPQEVVLSPVDWCVKTSNTIDF